MRRRDTVEQTIVDGPLVLERKTHGQPTAVQQFGKMLNGLPVAHQTRASRPRTRYMMALYHGASWKVAAKFFCGTDEVIGVTVRVIYVSVRRGASLEIWKLLFVILQRFV